MTAQILTHIDIGPSPSMAAAMAIEPYTEFLCGADTTSGDSIRDSLTALQIDGVPPAATTCNHCKRIAELIGRGVGLDRARKQVAGVAR